MESKIRVFVLNGKLEKKYLKLDNKIKTIKELCLYLKRNYGLGGYYLEDNKKELTNFKEITICIYEDNINYFSSLC